LGALLSLGGSFLTVIISRFIEVDPAVPESGEANALLNESLDLDEVQ
jgi:hypothetical protein